MLTITQQISFAGNGRAISSDLHNRRCEFINLNHPTVAEVIICKSNRYLLKEETITETEGASLAAYLAILAATAGLQFAYQICPPSEGQPASYTDSQIQSILKAQGKSATINSIIGKYQQLCVQSLDTRKRWFRKNQCAQLGSQIVCSYTPSWSDNWGCAKLIDACPCFFQVQNGTIQDPIYKTDGNGSIVQTSNASTSSSSSSSSSSTSSTSSSSSSSSSVSTPESTSSSSTSTSSNLDTDSSNGGVNSSQPDILWPIDFTSRFGKNCRMFVSIDSGDNLMPLYSSFIDVLCNSWTGNSKNTLVFTSGAVQCMQNTFLNIFQQPLPVAGSTAGNGYNLNAQEGQVYTETSGDETYVENTMNMGQQILNEVGSTSIYSNALTPDYVNSVLGISDGTAFTSTLAPQYNLDVIPVSSLLTTTNDSENLQTLQTSIQQLNVAETNIASVLNQYLTQVSVSQAQEEAITVFDLFQGTANVVTLMAIMLYISVLGTKILMGNFQLGGQAVVSMILEVAIVYYFAMGDAWKKWALNAIFSLSSAVTETVTNSLLGDPGAVARCNYNLPYYIPQQQKVPFNSPTCMFPNANLNGSTESFELGSPNPLTGEPVYACMKGPFIYRPQYERPYIPVSYTGVSAYGSTYTKLLTVYCDTYNPPMTEQLLEKDLESQTIPAPISSVPATVIYDTITGEPIELQCPSGTLMEQGYRLSEYAKMGISSDNLPDVDTTFNGLVPTAIEMLNEHNQVIQLFPANNMSQTVQGIKTGRMNTVNYIDSVRSSYNKAVRLYPVIERFGYHRDESYVGLFDMLDCTVLSYFELSLKGGFQIGNYTSVLTFLSTGVFGIIVFLMLLSMTVTLLSWAAHIAQVYIVSIAGITICIYLSPILFPLLLFSQTKDLVVNSWPKRVIGFATQPIIMFTIVIIFLDALNIIMFGRPETFEPQSMFMVNSVNGDAQIDSENCWNNSLIKAPPACALQKLRYQYGVTFGLGMLVSVFNGGDKNKVLIAFIAGMVEALVLCYFLGDITAKAEALVSDFVGGGGGGLRNSPFNKIVNPKQVAGGMKKGASSIGGGVKKAVNKVTDYASGGKDDEEG